MSVGAVYDGLSTEGSVSDRYRAWYHERSHHDRPDGGNDIVTGYWLKNRQTCCQKEQGTNKNDRGGASTVRVWPSLSLLLMY